MTATLHGIDFSGARQAGHGIWLADTVVDGDSLRVERCDSAADRFGVAQRAPCLGHLCEFLRDAEVVGLDFPFGVPSPIHGCDTWEDSLEWVATVATDADAFQETCRSLAADHTDGERRDLRRKTDGPVGGLSPYGGRIFKQTFYGIRDVLTPLAQTDSVVVQPMQSPGEASGVTQLCEVYPAGTLNSLHLPSQNYKGAGNRESGRDRRRTIVERLESDTALAFATDVRGQLIDDAGGDALDAVLAALATYRAREADFEPDREYDPVEGHIYV